MLWELLNSVLWCWGDPGVCASFAGWEGFDIFSSALFFFFFSLVIDRKTRFIHPSLAC